MTLTNERLEQIEQRHQGQFTSEAYDVMELIADLRASRAQVETAERQRDEECSLCHVPLSTGSCNHLLDLGDGRVGLKREVWESLIEDRHRLHALEYIVGDDDA